MAPASTSDWTAVRRHSISFNVQGSNILRPKELTVMELAFHASTCQKVASCRSVWEFDSTGLQESHCSSNRAGQLQHWRVRSVLRIRRERVDSVDKSRTCRTSQGTSGSSVVVVALELLPPPVLLPFLVCEVPTQGSKDSPLTLGLSPG